MHVHLRYRVRTLSALAQVREVKYQVKYQVKYFTGLRYALVWRVWRERERERRHTFVDVGNRLM